ncbi:sulfurtransferase [Winogradskyella sp.]|uniref:sulfurtransferase n=1 Tax=Winogradskyella sp. TaxID=1883156 RepID=UPI0025EDDE36|nr:sulfurtransferase [Winogradskyella sp.]
MKTVDVNSSLVSVEWLKVNNDVTNLVVLDATINKVIDKSSEKIPNARFFDIKKKFSDTSSPFPSTLPSANQFQREARKLGVNQDSIIIVYDDKGIYSSARVWWLFKVFGFKNVAVLNGGLPEWKLKGFKLETYSDDIYFRGDFEANFNSELMTNFEGVNEFSQDSDKLIIDARSEARFKCLIDEPRVGLRRGTIPNSKNLPYTNLFDGNILKPITELSVIFNNLVEDKSQFVFSCGSGITACILALAATLCNYSHLIVYDGSWTEYGTLTK